MGTRTKAMRAPGSAFFFAAVFCAVLNAKAAEPPPLMSWFPPPAGGKPGIIEGLDLETLALLTESGTLHYFQPRAEKGRWDVVTGMMVHAPLSVVWEVVSDYEGLCRLMPETFDSCRLLSREGNKTVMQYRLHTSVLKFSFELELTDEITEDPLRGFRLSTVEGSLQGREVEVLLVPAGEDRTMVFMRYYGALRSMNFLVRMVLSLLPDLESPVYASASAYHLRSYKREAEKRAGWTPRPPPPLNYARLSPQTLLRLCNWYAGLVRETPEGKVVNALVFDAFNAPRDKVWEVMTDFEHYDQIFPDSRTVVEKREGNEVVLRQTRKTFSVYVFSYGFELHARYQLQKPERMEWEVIDGVYQGSKGGFALEPYAEGRKTFVFAVTGLATERDHSLAMKIAKSGAFPFDSAINLFFSRSVLNGFKQEVERRR